MLVIDPQLLSFSNTKKRQTVLKKAKPEKRENKKEHDILHGMDDLPKLPLLHFALLFQKPQEKPGSELDFCYHPEATRMKCFKSMM